MSSASESLERTRHFDHWTAQVESALQDTKVALQLGRLGAALLNANNAAFLPNIRGNQVIVPRSQRDVDSIAVLPRLPTDGALQPHPTLLQPTPYRKKVMEWQLKEAGYTKDRKRKALVAHLVWQVLRSTSKHDRAGLLTYNDDLPIHTSAIRHTFKRPALVNFSSRPIIDIAHYTSSVPDALKAAMGAQSFVGALDTDKLTWPSDTDEYTACWSELRGNHVSAIILRRAFETQQLLEPDLNRYESIADVFDVEELQKLLGIKPDEFMVDEPNIDDRLELVTRTLKRFYDY